MLNSLRCHFRSNSRVGTFPPYHLGTFQNSNSSGVGQFPGKLSTLEGWGKFDLIGLYVAYDKNIAKKKFRNIVSAHS